MKRVVLVHGTFDGDEDDRGERWWQTDGAMHKELTRRGLEVEAFQWSGENSNDEREKAAKALAKKIRSEDRPSILLGHSHGGNVIREAMQKLSRRHLLSVQSVTVGTPFLDRKISVLSSLLRYFMTPIYLLFFSIYMVLAQYYFWIFRQENTASESGLLFSEMFMNGLLLVLLGTMTTQVIKALFFRKTAYYRVGCRIKALSHPQDEAIAGLRYAFNYRHRGLSRKETATGIRGALAAPITYLFIIAYLALLLFLMLDEFIITAQGERFVIHVEWWVMFGYFISVLAIIPLLVIVCLYLLGFPIRFMLAFFASFFATPFTNTAISRSIRRASLGEDGRYQFVRVGSRPTENIDPVPLPEDIVTEVKDHADRHLAERAGDLRSLLFTDFDATPDIGAVMNEQFTWDELIHTAYFRVASFREFLGDRIYELATD